LGVRPVIGTWTGHAGVADTADHERREQDVSRNGPGNDSFIAEKARGEQPLPAGGRPAAEAGKPE
jgi:hypothetical protein